MYNLLRIAFVVWMVAGCAADAMEGTDAVAEPAGKADGHCTQDAEYATWLDAYVEDLRGRLPIGAEDRAALGTRLGELPCAESPESFGLWFEQFAPVALQIVEKIESERRTYLHDGRPYREYLAAIQPETPQWEWLEWLANARPQTTHERAYAAFWQL